MSRHGIGLFLAMGLIWGTPYLFIKEAVDSLAPATVVCVRTLGAALLLLPIAAHRGALRPALARWPWVLAFGAIEMAGPFMLLSRAEQTLPSGLTGLLVSTVPLVAAVIAFAGGDRGALDATRVGGLVVGMVGRGAGGRGRRRRHGRRDPRRRGPADRGLLRRRPVHRGPAAQRHTRPRADHDLARRGRPRVPPGGAAHAGRHPDRPLDRGGGRPRRRVHGAGVRGVLRPDRRGRPHPGAADHLRQPGRRPGAGRDRARRAGHHRDARRGPAGPRRLLVRGRRRPGPVRLPRSGSRRPRRSSRPARGLPRYRRPPTPEGRAAPYEMAATTMAAA